jgi:hypothetical protein
MRRGSILLVFATVLVAACSSGSKTASNTSLSLPASTVAASTTTTLAAPPTTNAALVAKASAALYQAADFPAAFKAQPDGGGTCPASASSCSSLNLETIWSDMMTCLGVHDAPYATATSPTYLEGLATQARATVEYTSASSADAIATAMASPQFQSCATTAFTADAKRSAPQGGTPGPVTVTPLSVPQVGQKVSAIRANVTMNLQSLQVKIFQDFVVAFNGGTVVRMFFLNPGSAFPATLEQSLLQKVVTQAGAS